MAGEGRAPRGGIHAAKVACKLLILLGIAACDPDRRPVTEGDHDARRAAIDATVVEATAVDATAVDATAVDATAVDATAPPDAAPDAEPADPCLASASLDETTRNACFSAAAHRPPPVGTEPACRRFAEANTDLPDEALDLLSRNGWSLLARARAFEWFLAEFVPPAGLSCGEPGETSYLFAWTHCFLEVTRWAVEARTGTALPPLDWPGFVDVPPLSTLRDRELQRAAELLTHRAIRDWADILAAAEPPTCLFEPTPPPACACDEPVIADSPCPAAPQYLFACTCEAGRVHCDAGAGCFPCTDGTPLECCGWPLDCPEQTLLTVQAGCWVCVNPDTCQPP